MKDQSTREEKLAFDVTRAYVCNAEAGVPNPWNGRLDYWDAGLNMGSTMRLDRIGLIVAHNESRTLRDLLTQGTICLNLDQKRYTELSFAAFFDAAMSQPEAVLDELAMGDTKVDVPIFSYSLPLGNPLPVPPRQHYDVTLEVPGKLETKIKLGERDVFAYLSGGSKSRPTWSIAIGVRLIGERTRALL